MGRKACPVLSPEDRANWRMVVEWISKKFDRHDLFTDQALPINSIQDTNNARRGRGRLEQAAKSSWRAIQARWAHGWHEESGGNPDFEVAYFTQLVIDTNHWIDAYLPPGGGGGRDKLQAAVRQYQVRMSRKSQPEAVTVTVLGDLARILSERVPSGARAGLVKAALRLVLTNPTLTEQAMRLAGQLDGNVEPENDDPTLPRD